jgi:hypothetical protein
MTTTTVSARHPEDILAIVNKATIESTNLLLLYNERVDDLLSTTLRDFAQDGNRLVVLLSGDRIRSAEEFYEEIRRAVPFADYMGTNLDALEDVLRFEALSAEPEKDNYWIWEKSHLLYQRDSESFRRIYEVMVECSIKNRTGQSVAVGDPQPWQDRSPRRLVLILTGKHKIMASDVLSPNSYFYKSPKLSLSCHPSTQTVAYHLK